MFKELTDVKVLTKGKHVILFGAEWCAPCGAMKAGMEQHIIPNAKDTKFWHVDMMKADPKLYEKFEVTTLPTIICMSEGRSLSYRDLRGVREFLGIHAKG